MHLRHLEISHIKLLEAFEVDFLRPDGSPRPWTVFVGENGKCKTTILQAIALAASGPEKSNQVANNLPGLLIDKRDIPGSPGVTASFGGPRSPALAGTYWPGLSDENGRPTVRSEISMNGSVFEGSSRYVQNSPEDSMVPSVRNPLSQIRAQNLPGWLCVAYGVNRNIPIPLSVETRSDIAGDRVRSLFDFRYQLVGTDFVARFEPSVAQHYSRLLQQALVDFAILPGIEALELRGRGGITHPSSLVESHRFDQRVGDTELRLPAIALSHGYQSTIAWVADFVGQAMVDAGERAVEVELETMEGIVLIDEIDLHLHPRWQRGLIRTLKSAFPKVQFIATTHSPLVLAGLEKDEVYILQSDAHGSVTAAAANEEARLMTASGILQTFFGVDRVDPDDAGAKLREYGFLASTAARTDQEQAKLDSLLAELESLGVKPDWEPVPRKQPEEEALR